MLSILMLVYNIENVISEMTQQAVRSVVENTEGEYELILFKNGGAVLDWTIYDMGIRQGLQISTDNGDRIGLAEAYNRAANAARGGYLCVLHNDVLLPKGWDVPLVRAAGENAVAFPMVDESRSNCEQRGIPKTRGWQTTGACFVLSRNLWDRLGGYDEEYKGFHWEDTDLFYRAMKTGAAMVRCPVTIIHHRGATRTFTRQEESGYFMANLEYHKRKHGDAYAPAISESPQEV